MIQYFEAKYFDVEKNGLVPQPGQSQEEKFHSIMKRSIPIQPTGTIASAGNDALLFRPSLCEKQPQALKSLLRLTTPNAGNGVQ